MKKIAFLFIIMTLFIGCKQPISEKGYLAGNRPYVSVFTLDTDEQLIKSDSLIRGSAVVLLTEDIRKQDKQKYIRISSDNKQKQYVALSDIIENKEDCVREDSIWVRTAASVIDDTLSSHICGLAEKGMAYQVIGYDYLHSNGMVNRYKIACNDTVGYIYGKYIVFDKDKASVSFQAEVYDKIHAEVRNPYGGGEALGCDFYPVEKPVFTDNPMPDECYTLYLNISPAVIGKIDSFIDLAKQTKINAFVLDMKDNECPAFKAEAMERYSPTNFKWGGKNKEKMYEYACKRLHEEGFYIIGRITCFKDSYFVKDNPDCAITSRKTGEPFFHNKAYWPSAYDRRVWQFNVELAKECVRKFHLNEINFDYVRFPDKMQSIEDSIDYHNQYNETKVQAIQRFVQYACDEIHAVRAYVSVDVFGETTNKGYTSPYGQYWPAMSNVADVICGMPYPDHFAAGYGGMAKPWNNPYATLKIWGTKALGRQAECPTPAQMRTWIQSYHVLRYVDPNGIAYDADNIQKEIEGLYDAGVRGGYITWLSNSSLVRYREKRGAFEHDYLKEALDREKEIPIINEEKENNWDFAD